MTAAHLLTLGLFVSKYVRVRSGREYSVHVGGATWDITAEACSTRDLDKIRCLTAVSPRAAAARPTASLATTTTPPLECLTPAHSICFALPQPIDRTYPHRHSLRLE
ncbi:hypothetical protein C8Q78DRAFT_512148 [Trametes maxima]|nr:hypothetical protein C8Q78DRAFT_512148 [Trametes maxima]